MATNPEEKAREAFIDNNFDIVVDLYTQAINMDPENADLYANRAQANIKINNFTEAVADANTAIERDPSMPKAYLHQGTACIKLEQYQTAKVALEAGLKLVSGDSKFTKLIKECDERIFYWQEKWVQIRRSILAWMDIVKVVAKAEVTLG